MPGQLFGTADPAARTSATPISTPSSSTPLSSTAPPTTLPFITPRSITPRSITLASGAAPGTTVSIAAAFPGDVA